MKSNMPGSGDVKIELDGHGVVYLRPTLDAAIKLSSMPGGIAKVVDRCMSYEFDAILSVISYGLGGPSKELPSVVYKTGMVTLAPACIHYLHVLANGGKPISDDDDDDDDDNEEQHDPLANSSP